MVKKIINSISVVCMAAAITIACAQAAFATSANSAAVSKNSTLSIGSLAVKNQGTTLKKSNSFLLQGTDGSDDQGQGTDEGDSDGEKVIIVPGKTVMTKIYLKRSNNVKITWKKASNADGYYIERKKNDGGWKRIATVSASKLTYEDTKTACVSTYSYRAIAFADNDGEKTTGSYHVNGIKIKTKHAQPTLIYAKANYDKSIKVKWTKECAADGYFLYRKVKGGKWKKIATIKKAKTTSYKDKYLTYQKKYSYSVRAFSKEKGKIVQSTRSNKGISTRLCYHGKIAFRWPVPSCKQISSYFGPRSQPTAGASTYHKAIDIPASSGAKILAAAKGTVIESAYSSAKGNYVIISHGSGYRTEYMHMSSRSVHTGQKVKAGKMIGRVGSTGVSTGPHLHFSVYKNGVALNPLYYVKK